MEVRFDISVIKEFIDWLIDWLIAYWNLSVAVMRRSFISVGGFNVAVHGYTRHVLSATACERASFSRSWGRPTGGTSMIKLQRRAATATGGRAGRSGFLLSLATHVARLDHPRRLVNRRHHEMDRLSALTPTKSTPGISSTLYRYYADGTFDVDWFQSASFVLFLRSPTSFTAAAVASRVKWKFRLRFRLKLKI